MGRRFLDRFSSIAIRLALCWLVLGIVAGALMLNDDVLPGYWKLWLSPTHAHVLLVGWFFQFTLGVAYWLLPRKRSPERPAGYDERLGFTALALINVGLALRCVAEPLQRAGHDGVWIDAGLAVSAVLQVIAFGIVAIQLWPRVAAKAARAKITRAANDPATTGQEGGS
jgi:hypothetical protein